MKNIRTKWVKMNKHCFKSVLNRSFSAPYFPAFKLTLFISPNAENKDQTNSEYRHFLRSEGS